ncbi:hypothetical protein QE177_07535 [Arsenophonus sp. aPb]|uniref:hypothetical protein n=1 Tax=Arsenophonus sp. aPb TaxID=3041619 RepID=UPI002469A829|nr:hypothetical protein [Arsenophonus sp. aPb]WGL97093.1 hypothetical protein QE177_07535 [Arsenophonus sp. aPb]
MSYNNATMPISLTSYKKLNPDREFIAIKLYPVSKEINNINNSAQRLANNVKLNDSGLNREKNIVSTLSNFSVFLNSHLHDVFMTAKNAENTLQQAKLQSENLYSTPFDVIREQEPIYHVPNDAIEKQVSVNNRDHYSVIDDGLNNDKVYHAHGYAKVGGDSHIYATVNESAVGEKPHIYDEIGYAAIGENEEPIYEEIGNYASDRATNHLHSNKEINITKPNNFSSIENMVFAEVKFNNERNKITQLAEQTFAVPKSFISRLASSIWNALFGTKNESKIVPPAELVARAMHLNIKGVCDALNNAIAEKNVDGIFRQPPNNSIYKKDDPEKLLKAFNNDNCFSDPIALAWMVKLYIDQNMPKITMEEFNTINGQKLEQKLLADLIEKKIDQVNSNKTKDNLKACFTTIANTLKFGKTLGSNDNPFNSVNIIGSMLTGLIKQPEEFVAEEFVAKQLDSEGFFSEKFAVKASYDKEFATKLNAAKKDAAKELNDYMNYINYNKNEISNLIGNTLINS